MLKNYQMSLDLSLKEDIGKGDITTDILLPQDKKIRGKIIAKDNFVLCGVDFAKEVFKVLNKNIKFRKKFKDGERIVKKQVIAEIEGSAKAILAGERTALNIIQRLSAIATKTRKFVDKAKKYNVEILDTRKTTPNFRLFEKYAVKVGGGKNHRLGLHSGVLIKDNHIAILGSAKEAVRKCKMKDAGCKIEIEVKTLEQLKEVLPLKPDIILLDNMSIKEITLAKKIIGNLAKIEVSGGVNLKNVEKIAKCGVDYISVGELTHSVKSVDISLEVL